TETGRHRGVWGYYSSLYLAGIIKRLSGSLQKAGLKTTKSLCNLRVSVPPWFKFRVFLYLARPLKKHNCMEYSKIIAVSGLPGLHELISSKNDGAIVRSLEDKSTKFVSSRIHN